MKKFLAIFLICVLPTVCLDASPKFGIDYTADEIDDLLASINYAFVTSNDVLTGITGTELETLSAGNDASALHTHDHNILSASHSDAANTGAPTRGSLMLVNSDPNWAELVIGAAGTFFKSDGTDAAWTTITGFMLDAGTPADNTLVRFDGTDGVTTQTSGIVVDDSDNMSGIGTIASGAITATVTNGTQLTLVDQANAVTFSIDTGTGNLSLSIPGTTFNVDKRMIISGTGSRFGEVSSASDVNAIISNTNSNNVNATASLLFQGGAGRTAGKIVSNRISNYDSDANADSTLDFFYASNGTDVFSGRFSSSGFTSIGPITTSLLGTFGEIDVDTLNFNNNKITDSTGTVNFDDEILVTTGNMDADFYSLNGTKSFDSNGTRNLQIGELAGSNDAGADNVFIGFETGKNNDTTGAGNEGKFNVYIGTKSGKGDSGTNNTGFFNVGLGADTLRKNTTGSSCLAMGAFSLANNTTGLRNTAVGDFSLNANISGNNNVAVGQGALTTQTTASFNTAVGFEALKTLSAGQGQVYNTAMGYIALRDLTTGTRNTAVGAISSEAVTQGGRNSSLGWSALSLNQTGSNNTAMGYGSLQNVTLGNNTALGYKSGEASTTASGNVYLGNLAGALQTTLDNTLLIDNQSRGSAAAELTSSLVHGTFNATVANQVLRVNGTLEVGNATTGQITKLGDGGSTDYLEVSSSGDLVFVGGAGLVFGSMYNNNTPTTVTIGTSGVFERVPSGFTVGQLNNTTFANAREITVLKAGKYEITWSLSFNSDGGSNLDMEGAIGINNTKNDQGTAHRKIGAGNDIGNIASCAILDLAANAVVSLMMTNNTNTVNIIVDHGTLVVSQVGG